MSPEEFRHFGHRLIDWISDYHASADTRSVMAKVAPGAIKARLPAQAPDWAEPMEAVLRDFEEIVAPGLTDWQNPRFFGYFPANSLPAGMLGDMLSTGLGVLGLSWQSSPAVTELEEVVTDWVRQMVGLSDRWSGVIQDSASTSTLVALICAREAATGFALARAACRARPGRRPSTLPRTLTAPSRRRPFSPGSGATICGKCRMIQSTRCVPTLCRP